ncbi:MAG: DNA polymerase ligase N-terminal domain-containing protein [Pirellulales bacterium]
MTDGRFVIHYHQLPPDSPRPSHWDLMFELHGQLATWALERPPTEAHPETINARRLDDHRLAYLDYEGPVSGGRGTVTRYDSGDFDWSWPATTRASGSLRGQRLQGTFQLVAQTDEPLNWQFLWQPLPAN